MGDASAHGKRVALVLAGAVVRGALFCDIGGQWCFTFQCDGRIQMRALKFESQLDLAALAQCHDPCVQAFTQEQSIAAFEFARRAREGEEAIG